MAASCKVVHVNFKVCNDILSPFDSFIDILGGSQGFSAAGSSINKINHINKTLSDHPNLITAAENGTNDANKPGYFFQNQFNYNFLHNYKNKIKAHT